MSTRNYSDSELFSPSSDSSYHVDSEESDTDSDTNKLKKRNQKQQIDTVPNSNSILNSAETSAETLQGNNNLSNVSNNTVFVSAIEKKYDKRTSCKYCHELVLKLPRHLIRKHEQEKEVIEFCSLPPKHPKRLNIISKLRKEGNFIHNNTKFENKEGNLIVTRRPSAAQSGKKYLPCPSCLGYYSRRTLYLHAKRCKTLFVEKSRIQKTGQALLPANKCASDLLRTKILPYLKNDHISEIIKNDKLILLFGSDLALKLCREQHLHNHIRQRMRELARLVVELRKVDDSMKNLEDVFDSSKAEIFFKAVSNLTQLNVTSGSFGKPSTAIKLRTSIHTCAQILLAQAVPDESKRSKIQQFLSVISLKFKRYCTLAIQTIDEQKWNKPVTLPESDEIKEFSDYLDKEQQHLFEKLCKRYEYIIWNRLSKVVLVNILLFNRRRAGESQMLKISEFNKRHNIDKESDLYKMLSNVEKEVSNNYYRIQIRGKLRNGVPILISKFQVQILKLIIKYRRKAGVSDQNPYVFGRLNNSFIRATDAVRMLTKESGIKHPEKIRSTTLRKQLSTQVQVLNLKDNELDDLANSMGHDIRVHRSYYRLPDHMVQIAKTGKLLLAAKENIILKNQGRSLDELEFRTFPSSNDTSDLSHYDIEETEVQGLSEKIKNIYRTPSKQDKNCSYSSRDSDTSSPDIKTRLKILKRKINNNLDAEVSSITDESKEHASSISSAMSSNEKSPTIYKTSSKLKKYSSDSDSVGEESSITGESKRYVSSISSTMNSNETSSEIYKTFSKQKKYLSDSDSAEESSITTESKRRASSISSAMSSNEKSFKINKTSKQKEYFSDSNSVGDESTHVSVTTPKSNKYKASDTSAGKKKVFKRKGACRWITPEKRILREKFSKYLETYTVPGKEECETVLHKSPLKRRNWRDIKNWIHNTNVSSKRRLSKCLPEMPTN